MTPARDPLILGLTGRAGAGKSSAADYLCSRYGFVQFGLADPLRDMLQVFLDHADIDHACLAERDLKERPLPSIGPAVTPRSLMQTLGTEWGRNQVARDVWVRLLERRTGLAAAAPVHDRIVVSDVRFANEADWVRRQGGIVARLVREQPMQAWPMPHSSEQGVPTSHITHVIDNAGTLGQLHSALDGLCRTLAIDERGEGPEIR